MVAAKMVAGFNRSFSLPGSPLSKTRPGSNKSYHVRSVSLPCRSHPLISQLEHEIGSVNNWISSKSESVPNSASWLCDGLSRLELLHTSLYDLLNLPQNQDSLRRGSGSRSEWTDRILDDFLRFADAYDVFRSHIVIINEHIAEAEISIRRNEPVKLASVVRSMKKTERNLIKLASSIRDACKLQGVTKLTDRVEDGELAGIVREAANATVSASAMAFMGIAAACSATTAAMADLWSVSSSWTTLRKMAVSFKSGDEGRNNVMERLAGLEECVGAIEHRSERLFGCFVNSRVSLLNILTR